MPRRNCALLTFVLWMLIGSPSTAFAHPGHGGHSFTAGWQHPFLGADHLLAMFAVGLLAVRIGGRALWIMPGTFVGGMLLGGMAAAFGVPLPGVEQGILASVLVLGILIAMTRDLPLKFAAALVVLFALFHGYAHIAEMTASNSVWTYAIGFTSATTVLHLLGVSVGLVLTRSRNDATLRVAGGFISAAGLFLLCCP